MVASHMIAFKPEVVLAEDNEGDEMLSLLAIQDSNVDCRVTVVRDGLEATNYLLRSDSWPPALIILDYRMPKKNGLQILREIRRSERFDQTPVVIFSGTNEGPAMLECYECGANSCVSKPVEPRDYRDRISAITSYWLTVNVI